jgi:hypothetical protein
MLRGYECGYGSRLLHNEIIVKLPRDWKMPGRYEMEKRIIENM